MIPLKLKNIISFLNSKPFIKDLELYSNVYLVGGSVRDCFLDKNIKDIDIIVEGLSLSEIKNVIEKYGNVDIVGESFAVIKFSTEGFDEPIDIAIPRIDKKIGIGHKGFEVITKNVSIIEDLKRRDFTINSIAVNIKTQELIDPFNGLKDLKNGIIKATDPDVFIDDALRILRGIQFSSRFNFAIDYNTLQLMKTNAHLIKEISGERILGEFNKILKKGGNVNIALRYLKVTGIDKQLLGKELEIIPSKNDEISMYYILCKTANEQNPASFFNERLKGEASMAKNISVLDNVLKTFSTLNNDEHIKWLTFNMIKQTPDNEQTHILPQKIKSILKDMNDGLMPKTINDLHIDGNDVIAALGKQGPEVGKVLQKFILDALMNRFNWKNEDSSLEHLANIIINKQYL